MKPVRPLPIALLLAPGAGSPAADLPLPAGIEHVRVERSDSDKYQFLHAPAMEPHLGDLFAAWYNYPNEEIVGESLILCRRSNDGGTTWGTLGNLFPDDYRTFAQRRQRLRRLRVPVHASQNRLLDGRRR